MSERASTKSRRFKLPEEASVIFALLLLIAIVGTLRPIFLKPENLLNLAASYSISALLAGCIVYLLSMGEIDLSFGWILNLSAVIAGVSMIAGVPVWIAIIIGIIAGGVMGAINGVLTVVMRLPLIIVTLGTASVYQGISLITNKSGSVVPTDEKITTNIFFRALGGDIETPIPIKQTKILVCALMGFVSGIGGVLFLGFRGAVDPTTGANLLLPVVAAAIIGGTALSGGAGTVWGSLYGALIVGVIGVGVVFLGIDAVWSTLVTGLVILFAIGVDQIVRVRKNRAG